MQHPEGTVVLLGAGASSAFGLPLTKDILRKMIERLKPDPPDGLALFTGPHQSALASELRGALAVLYPGLDVEAHDAVLPNITDVLSLLDHLILYEYPASRGFGTHRLTRARRLLERGMMEVLVGGDLWPVVQRMLTLGERGYFERVTVERRMTTEEQSALHGFMKWLDAKKQHAGPLTIVTTNYDVAVETELFASIGIRNVSTSVDFGFDWRDPYDEVMIPRPVSPHYRLYKLHGSLNWLRCDLCDQVYVNPQEAIAYLSFVEDQHLWNTCHCGSHPLRPVIVAPSMVRDVRDPHLLNVWRNATEALRTAREWFIVGYSLPAEDLAIRAMLLRAFGARGLEDGPKPLADRAGHPGPAVTVVQKGPDARPAYAALFADFTYLEGGIGELIRDHG